MMNHTDLPQMTEDFDRRVRQTLQDLPAQPQRARRRPFRTLIAVGAAAAAIRAAGRARLQPARRRSKKRVLRRRSSSSPKRRNRQTARRAARTDAAKKPSTRPALKRAQSLQKRSRAFPRWTTASSLSHVGPLHKNMPALKSI